MDLSDQFNESMLDRIDDSNWKTRTRLACPACGVVNSQLAADDVGDAALVPTDTAERRAFFGGVGPSSVKATDPESSMASSSMSSMSQVESSVLALSSKMAGIVLVLNWMKICMDQICIDPHCIFTICAQQKLTWQLA